MPHPSNDTPRLTQPSKPLENLSAADLASSVLNVAAATWPAGRVVARPCCEVTAPVRPWCSRSAVRRALLDNVAVGSDPISRLSPFALARLAAGQAGQRQICHGQCQSCLSVYGMAWNGTVRYGRVACVVWHGMAWHGTGTMHEIVEIASKRCFVLLAT